MARILAAVLLFSLPGFSECIPISQAAQHLGQKACVTGKVLTVTKAEHDARTVNFCLPNVPCPFVVRVFPIDFDYVGDVQQLVGKDIEITGKIKQSNGRAEIVLKDANQLRGASAKMLLSPKPYDVQQQSLKRFSGKERSLHRHSRRPQNEGGEEFNLEKQ